MAYACSSEPGFGSTATERCIFICTNGIQRQIQLHLQLLALAMQEEAEADPLDFVTWLQQGFERSGGHVAHSGSGMTTALCLTFFPLSSLRPCTLLSTLLPFTESASSGTPDSQCKNVLRPPCLGEYSVGT